MTEKLHLVSELAIILIAAGTFTIISRALKQPLILGYIVAGLIVGPKLGLFPQFSPDAINEWAELGIIFLLFGLGLEFSFKKLLKIGSSALITAGTNCIGMFILGVLTGRLMGWGAMEGIFLGGMMSMSSTTIIVKAYDEMSLKSKPYAGLIFGALVFEDLIAVILMVLLSTLAVTGKFAGMEMLLGILKLIFFMILWFLVGIYVLPTLLKKTKNYINDEIMLVVSVGLCFMMVVIANVAGFSSALGAFVMGSLLAETLEGYRIEKLISSIKNLFGAIFFVSVGMMVDPAVIIEHWLPILIITVITMTGILLFSTVGALLAGQGLNTAVHAGFTLAQLGEFSFIIAGLGCSMGVLREFIYPVIISVSVITTFTTPYMIRLGDPVADFLERHLPDKVLKFLTRSDDKEPVNSISKAESNEWKKVIRAFVIRVTMYGVICLAIIIGSEMYLTDTIKQILPGSGDASIKLIKVITTIIALIPFMYGLSSTGKATEQSCAMLLKKNPNNKWPILAIVLIKTLISTLFVAYVIDHNYAMSWWTLVLILLSVAAFIMFSRNSIHHFSALENTFLKNFNEKEEEEKKLAPVTTRMAQAMRGYDVRIKSVVISQEFNYIGKTMREMPFRKGSGINIIKIQRGSRNILIPSGDEPVYPGDKLYAVGTSTQLEKFESVIAQNTTSVKDVVNEEFAVEPITIDENSTLLDQNLRAANLRASGCMVVSVMRDGKLITNPTADFVFQLGDIAWIAGEKSSVEWHK